MCNKTVHNVVRGTFYFPLKHLEARSTWGWDEILPHAGNYRQLQAASRFDSWKRVVRAST